MNRTCTINGCDGVHVAKGMCRNHYERFKRNGHPGLRTSDPTDRSRRFWAKVDRSSDAECWIWMGAKNALGYGNIPARKPNGQRTTQPAHRFAYEEQVGPIPAGLVLDHLCRNPSCVNPAHLEPVPQRVNLLRGETFNRRNARKQFCPNGHPLDAENTLVWVRKSGSVHRKCRECDRDRHRTNRRYTA